MFIYKEEFSDNLNRALDDADYELLRMRQEYGDWREVIHHLGLHCVNTQEFDFKMKTAFTLWGMEQYGFPVEPSDRQSLPGSNHGTLGAFNL